MTSRIAQSRHHNVFKHSGSLDGRRRNVIRCEPHTLALKAFYSTVSLILAAAKLFHRVI